MSPRSVTRDEMYSIIFSHKFNFYETKMHKRRHNDISDDQSGEYENIKRRKVDPAPASKLCIFDLPELVEIIISYLFNYSKTIYTLSMLSKRHRKIVHSRAMWVRLGLSPTICKGDNIPTEDLLFILHKLRIKRLRSKMEKYAIEISALTNHDYRNLDLDIGDSQPDPDYYCEEFYTNTTLTDEASVLLLKMVQKSQVIMLRLPEIVDCITCSQTQLERRYSVHHEVVQRNVKTLLSNIWVCMDLISYPGLYAPSKIIRPLIMLSTDAPTADHGDNIRCSVWKAFIDEHRSVTFMYSRVMSALEINDSLIFVKYNSQSNLIEICGSFEGYAVQTFGNSTKEVNRAFNTLLELADDGNDERWLQEFKRVGWKMALLQDDVRQEFDAAWYRHDEIGHNIQFFRK